jgi:type VI secretion system protein ImpF
MAERGGLFQVSLMNVFRQSAREHDSRERDDQIAEGDRVLSARSIERREGAPQTTLRDHLALDLGNLMSTIHLEAAQDLNGLDNVKKSILNFGLQDLSRLTTDDTRIHKLARDLREALLTHEPRLIAESLKVNLRKTDSGATQRIAFEIEAEMAARPVDVPLEFVAEIDSGAGKVAITNLVVRG